MEGLDTAINVMKETKARLAREQTIIRSSNLCTEIIPPSYPGAIMASLTAHDGVDCHVRTLEHFERPPHADAGYGRVDFVWYDVPEVVWACRIPGYKKYEEAHNRGAVLARHLKAKFTC